MHIRIDKYKDASRQIIDNATEITIGNDYNDNLNLGFFVGDKYSRIPLHKYDKIKIEAEELLVNNIKE